MALGVTTLLTISSKSAGLSSETPQVSYVKVIINNNKNNDNINVKVIRNNNKNNDNINVKVRREEKSFVKLSVKYFVQIFSAHFCRPQGGGRMNIN